MCNGAKGLKIHMSKCKIAKNAQKNSNSILRNNVSQKCSSVKNQKDCRSDCKTCPNLIKKGDFISTTTGRTYKIININIEDIKCKLHNYIYLLTCKNCGV